MGMGTMGGGRGRGRGRGRRAPMSEINVTPLVDVMLVLLIIFMVTAPLLTAGVPINLPDSRAAALPQEQQQVTISIDEAGFVYIDDNQVPEGGLPDALANLPQSGEGPDITLRADRALDLLAEFFDEHQLAHAGAGFLKARAIKQRADLVELAAALRTQLGV